MGRIVVIGVFLVLAAVGCAGGDDRPEADKSRSVDEELSALPDAGPGLGEASPPPGLRAGWKTDFSKRSVSEQEFMSGGPGKDGIPAVDDPKFVAVEDADFLEDREPVIELVVEDDARAYPIQILIWHEIVNDVVGGVPVAVTFCPLCNAAIAFDRRLDRQTLDFGTTGNLRSSDLVMYDRQTESWWQQFGGEALVGRLTGASLEQLPSRIVSWADFRREHAGGRVLSRDTGFARPYGENPYVGYDSRQLADLPDEERRRRTTTAEGARRLHRARRWGGGRAVLDVAREEGRARQDRGLQAPRPLASGGGIGARRSEDRGGARQWRRRGSRGRPASPLRPALLVRGSRVPP
jgi:hypothetical protein